MSLQIILVYFVIALICAYVAEKSTPALIPGGITTCMLVGFLGAWVGGFLFRDLGPNIAGVHPLSSVLFAAFLVFGLTIIARALRFKNV